MNRHFVQDWSRSYNPYFINFEHILGSHEYSSEFFIQTSDDKSLRKFVGQWQHLSIKQPNAAFYTSEFVFVQLLYNRFRTKPEDYIQYI